RRRHTRCLSDWSSDVCSSDLSALTGGSPTSGSVEPYWRGTSQQTVTGSATQIGCRFRPRPSVPAAPSSGLRKPSTYRPAIQIRRSEERRVREREKLQVGSGLL